MDERHPPEESGPSRICRAFLDKLARTPDKAKRQAILAACVKVRSPWVEELLWEALADPNEGVRDLVVKELRRRESLHLEFVLKRLRFPPWYARSSTLRIIGCRRIREAVPEMVRAVGDANVEVRRAAAEALGEMGGNEALRLLVALKKDANPYVRAAAEQAIRKTSGVRFS
jgi:HEAT repeat protein